MTKYQRYRCWVVIICTLMFMAGLTLNAVAWNFGWSQWVKTTALTIQWLFMGIQVGRLLNDCFQDKK